MGILAVLIFPLPAFLLDLLLAVSIIISVLIMMTGPVHRQSARIHRLPDPAARRDAAAARPEPRLDPPDPRPRPRGHGGGRPRHRGVRQLRDGRQLRHRDHRVRDPDHRELRRDHEGLGPHRRGRRPLHPRRDAGQADGHRRRPLGRPDRREGGQGPPRGPGGGILVLRRHGRCLEVRPRRRDRGPADHLHQRDRRHHHRRRAAGHAASATRPRPTPCSPSATAWPRRCRR